jgi:hypothetical protein
MANFKSLAKRKREQAKLDKRQAKDQKRAVRKAERSGTDVATPTPTPTIAAVAPARFGQRPPVPSTLPSGKPKTLSEAVELWRKTKVAKPKDR